MVAAAVLAQADDKAAQINEFQNVGDRTNESIESHELMIFYFYFQT